MSGGTNMDRVMRIGAVVAAWGLLVTMIATGRAQASADAAVVTMLDGTAQAFLKGTAAGTPIKKNDRVQRGQEIRVGDRSRLELRFPDGTVMRFAERSTIRMDDLTFDSKTRNKKVRVDMERGKLWASVRKLVTSDSRVEVKTVNAVAGVRGTVYRVNVEEDNSALVKVYDGSVYVDGVKKEEQTKAPAGGFTAPVPVPGPSEVPPPYHEVTMEEWHVIVKSFQQITISPNGVASQPQDFNPQQDLDDWVRWNQERDKALQF
jgi:hypothetical protein